MESSAPPESQSCGVCRATGTVTLTGVAGWLMYERSRVDVKAIAHRRTVLCMSLLSLGAAVVRWRAG